MNFGNDNPQSNSRLSPHPSGAWTGCGPATTSMRCPSSHATHSQVLRPLRFPIAIELLCIIREFRLEHLPGVEQYHGMQATAMRAVGHRVADNTDPVAGFKRILRPTETLQDGRTAGDDIPSN